MTQAITTVAGSFGETAIARGSMERCWSMSVTSVHPRPPSDDRSAQRTPVLVVTASHTTITPPWTTQARSGPIDAARFSQSVVAFELFRRDTPVEVEPSARRTGHEDEKHSKEQENGCMTHSRFTTLCPPPHATDKTPYHTHTQFVNA